MKYFLIFFYTVTSVLVLYFFSSIEKWVINSNFSWTSAKIAPYLLLVIFGILIARWFSKFFIYKIISNRMKFLRPIVFMVITAIPFVVGFVLNPIYEGDFSKQGTEIQNQESINDFRKVDLAVITIPGCPYCYHSISKLKQLKARNPEMNIKFIVCTSNSEDLKDYIAEGGKEIVVSKTKNIETLSKMAQGKFPTFVMIKNNKGAYRWSNDQFGCLALDQLESEFSN
jgi:thioredoxin-related protein